MTEPQQKPSILSAVARRAAQLLLAAGLLVSIYVEALTAYTNVQKFIQTKAVSDNAAVKQHAGAVLEAEKAKAERQTARNAADKLVAEADKAEADASKLESEAKTAHEQALNAAQKTRDEARAGSLKVLVKQQEALALFQEARNAAAKMKAVADKVEPELQTLYSALETIVYTYNLSRCPGSNYMEQIDAAYRNRC